MPSHDLAALAEVVTALKQALSEHLVAVILFGSRARDRLQESSDWDLLVIARDLPVKILARHLLLKNVLPCGLAGARRRLGQDTKGIRGGAAITVS